MHIIGLHWQYQDHEQCMCTVITPLFSTENDYVGVQRELTFDNILTEHLVSVELMNNDIPEDTEMFTLRLSYFSEEDSSIVVIPDQMIISIIDDDREERAITCIKICIFITYEVIIMLTHQLLHFNSIWDCIKSFYFHN